VRSVYEDTEEADHYYAQLTDYRPFRSAISYYTGPDEQPWEPWKSMRNSVRRIDALTFTRVLEAGGLSVGTIPDEWVAATDSLRRAYGKAYRPRLKASPARLRKMQRILEVFERPSHITNRVKAERGDTCQLCGQRGFLMRNGRRYCEVHHLFHLSDNPPAECLQPFYLVVLCATCHRRMHYAAVGEPEQCEGGWRVIIDGAAHEFQTGEGVHPSRNV
jgi:hypothetical protein